MFVTVQSLPENATKLTTALNIVVIDQILPEIGSIATNKSAMLFERC